LKRADNANDLGRVHLDLPGLGRRAITRRRADAKGAGQQETGDDFHEAVESHCMPMLAQPKAGVNRAARSTERLAGGPKSLS
jgi:hypothetical protein